MEEIIQNVIKELGITLEKYEEAYNFLYDEFGYTITLWEEGRLKKEINNYWKDRDKIEIDD